MTTTELMTELEKNPPELSRFAAALAGTYEADAGGIVLILTKEGVRMGFSRLSTEKIEEMLCEAIHRNRLCLEKMLGDEVSFPLFADSIAKRKG